MKKFLLKTIVKLFVKLSNSVLETIFSLVYPIYVVTHTNSAWKRTLYNLRKAGFSQQKISVRSVFKSLFLNEIDSIRYLTDSGKTKPVVYYENESVITNCLREGLPVVAVGIHQGAFEIQHRSLLRYAPKVHLFTSRLRSKTLNDVMRDFRAAPGLEEHDNAEVGPVLRQFLREKSVLAVAVDQSISPKPNEVKLFGRKSPLFLRLPIQACKMGAAVVTFRTFWIGGNEHVVHFENVYAPGSAENEIVAGIASEVETWITEHPSQWTWNYHRNFT